MKIDDTTRVVASAKRLRIWQFESENETAESILIRANADTQESINSWTRHLEKYPDNAEFQNYLKQEQEEKWEIMTYGEFSERERIKMLEGAPVEISKESWWDALECLPPMNWCTIQGVEMFCMSEMLSGSYTAQYARQGDKYYTKTVDAYDKTTWINNYLTKKAA